MVTQTAYKKALARMHTDRCTVTVSVAHKDPITHITHNTDEVLHENIPCKLSFQSIVPASGEVAQAITLAAKLFLDSSVAIPAGSRITITRPDGRVLHFTSSGEPGPFGSHQEIGLLYAERYA